MKDKILNTFQQNPESFLTNMGIYNLKYGHREAKGLCPLHSERNPSFSINIQSGLWRCFAGCGAGDIFSLYKKYSGNTGNFQNLLKEMESL